MSKDKNSTETDRFVNAVRKIVAVPKKDVDKQLEKERKKRQKVKKLRAKS